MSYYLLRPEVAGELGENSKVVYEGGRMKAVLHLEYVFTGWLGDELLTTHPCFIVTESLQRDIVSNNLKGVRFREIKMSFSEEFFETCKDTEFPCFVELICESSYEENAHCLQNDFYYNRYKELIVSEKTLEVINRHKVDMCNIEEV